MADFPDVKPNDETIQLQSANQSYSSVLTGDTQSTELAGDRWAVNLQFSNRLGREAAKLRAFVFGLGGKRTRFTYSPESINNLGTAYGSGIVDGASQLGSVLSTKGWDADQNTLFEAGDYLEVNGELKMVTADVAGATYIEYTDTNYMPSPFDPEGWNYADSVYSVVNESAANPSGEVITGNINVISESGASFSDSDAVDAIRGEHVAFSAIFRHIDGEFSVGANIFGPGGTSGANLVNANTLEIVAQSGDIKLTSISDDYTLMQVKAEVTLDGDHDGRAVLRSLAGGSPATLGSNVYAQAAFFGKNPLEYPYALYNEFQDSDEADEWTPTRCTISTIDGALSFIGTDDDSYMTRNTGNGLTSFDGSKYTNISVKWRRNSGSTFNQLFFNNGSGSESLSFSESNPDPRATTTGPDVDGFYTTEFSLEDDLDWTGATGGNIVSIRLDFGQTLPTDFDIDYIKIYSPDLLAAYEDWWPANLLATADIPIAPPLRNSPPDGISIITEKPSATFRLEDDDQAAFQVTGPLIYNASLSLVEDF